MVDDPKNLVTVFVQSCPQRRSDRLPTLLSIEESDIGKDYVLLEHPPEITKAQFFRSFLEEMSRASTPYVIRFEDDVLVNRHILYNALGWSALHEREFGVGWLGAPASLMRSGTVSAPGPMYWALGVILRTADVKHVIKEVDRRISKRLWIGQDLALSEFGIGKKIFFHRPSLIENRDFGPLRIGSRSGATKTISNNPDKWTAGPYFLVSWKRDSTPPPPVVSRFVSKIAQRPPKGMREISPGMLIAHGKHRRRKFTWRTR